MQWMLGVGSSETLFETEFPQRLAANFTAIQNQQTTVVIPMHVQQ